MAIDGKQSKQTVYNLDNESDLSEAALDGVVGGSYGPGGSGQVTKTQAHDQVVAEVSSLLHDAAAVHVLETKFASLESKSGQGQQTTAENTLKSAIGSFVTSDASTFADLSSKLSAQEMGKLVDAFGKADATNDSKVKSEASEITKDLPMMVHSSNLTPELAREHSEVTSYLHDAANTVVIQNHLDTAADGAGAGKTAGLSTSATQTLQQAMTMISDRDATTLTDPKLSATQIGALVDAAADYGADTTNIKIDADANKVLTHPEGGGGVGTGWSQVQGIDPKIIGI